MWLKGAPLVVKVFFTLWILGIAVAAVGGVVLDGGSIWMLPIAVVAIVFGCFLVLDLGGAARGLAATVAKDRPFGVDYSQSVFAKPGYARFFGGMMIVVGIGLVVAALTER